MPIESSVSRSLAPRQSHRERASFSQRTLSHHRTSGSMHNGVNNRQTQSCSSAVPRPRFIPTVKPLEDVRKSFGRDAATGVPDLEPATAIAAFNLHIDASSFFAVVDCILDQVFQNGIQIVA